MALPPIIAFCNQKGGVGKTSCTLLSAAELASKRGRNVLVVDTDQQGNSTTALMSGEKPRSEGVFGLICHPDWPTHVPDLVDVIEPAAPAWGSVDVVAGTQRLALVDTDMDETAPRRLARAFARGAATLANYDVVLMDCPPSIGRVMFIGLAAATHYEIVSEPTGASVEGMGRIESTVLRVRDAMAQEKPELLAVMINRMRRTTERTERLAEIRDGYGETALGGEISERAAVDDAYSLGVPIHSMTSEGARAVTWQIGHFWNQLWNRLGLPEALAQVAP
jgi:chromosome partitioning protein